MNIGYNKFKSRTFWLAVGCLLLLTVAIFKHPEAVWMTSLILAAMGVVGAYVGGEKLKDTKMINGSK